MLPNYDYALEAMYRVVEEGEGFDAIVIVSPTKAQADLWQRRLEGARGVIIGEQTKIFSVEEDWTGGAGQLLGTLYAWEKQAYLLGDFISKGGKAAIYHTAGRGMRLAPLPAAEGGNKSAVKLPRLVRIDGREFALTILEAVIFQTGIFAPSREGRLCVFWGDQIFVPEKRPEFAGNCEVEIFAIQQELAQNEEEWKRSWESYGLLIPAENGEVLQREKQTWDEVMELREKGLLGSSMEKVLLGKSLGSFSLSYAFLEALLEEFQLEIEEKRGKLDTDAHLWMPITSSEKEFELRGGDRALWERIDRFKKRFIARRRGLRLVTDKDLGEESFWWDFGQLKFYHRTLLRVFDDSREGECLRAFFGLAKHWVKHFKAENMEVKNSILLNSEVTGKVEESLLIGVKADKLKACRSVIIDSLISQTEVDEALVYNCVEPGNLMSRPGEAVADVFLSQGRVRMRTELKRDGKQDWEKRLPRNSYSYEELYQACQETKNAEKEKERWESYYQDREVLMKLAGSLKKGFVKPKKDNLIELVWGGDYIRRLKCLPFSEKKIGESWECSSHFQHPSIVDVRKDMDIPFPHLLNLMGEECLGSDTAREFKGELPILVKYIDAREDLSVQVHPSDEKAKELGEKESGKDEAWLILDADKGSVLYMGFKKEVDRKRFKKDILLPDVNIAEKYLNAIPVKEGDLFFNAAGMIHAIGKGIKLIEIQQTSGITYRVWDWNRRPQRTLHIEKAMKCLNFHKSPLEEFYRFPQKSGNREERLISSLYFSVDRLDLNPGDRIFLETKGSFHVLTCLEGEVRLESDSSTERLFKGESVFIPAGLESYTIVSMKKARLLKSFVLTPGQINPVIFQTYDIRAIANEDLPDRTVYYIGKGYGTYLRRIKQAPESLLWVAVGGGIRLSTDRIRAALIKGLLSSGVNVYDIGITSTPELYFAVPYLHADGGINITASHNEAEYNGLKQVIKDEDGFVTSIDAGQMLQLKQIVQSGDFLSGKAKKVKIGKGEIVSYHNKLVKANLRLGREAWLCLRERWKDKELRTLLDHVSATEFPEEMNDAEWERIRNLLELPLDLEPSELAVRRPFKDLKLVIDFGNGSSFRTKQVFLDLGADVVCLNEEPDGSFPAHIPDPIKARYRRQLEKKVLEVAGKEEDKAGSIPGYVKKEVVGFGYDEDGDRVIYVRSDGMVVEGDRTLAIQAKQIIEDHRGKGRPGKPRFMGEVKFSKVTGEFIDRHGGEYIMSPTGFAFIKEGGKKLCRAVKEGRTSVELFGRKVDLSENRETLSLAAELSGHQMSGHEENWIFDDGALAAAKVLGVIARALKKGVSFIDLDEEVPRYPVSPEINLRLGTNVLADKQEVVDQVVRIFKEKEHLIDTTDGGLIKWKDKEGKWSGQALIRKSNTQPMIICRVEGKDEESKAMIEKEFFHVLSHVKTRSIPKLDLASDEYLGRLLLEERI
jgi:phosphomannomutase/mannose-6-phosphate isomerase class I